MNLKLKNSLLLIPKKFHLISCLPHFIFLLLKLLLDVRSSCSVFHFPTSFIFSFILLFCILRISSYPTPSLEKAMAPHSSTLASKIPWGSEESHTTERLHFHFSLSCTGEGNGNPLQCSCLENPRDGGAWWAAVYEVAQSRTQLK